MRRTVDLIRAIEAHGGRLRLIGGRLRVSGSSRVPADLLAEVRERRAELIHELGKHARINAAGHRQEAQDKAFIPGGPRFLGTIPWGRR